MSPRLHTIQPLSQVAAGEVSWLVKPYLPRGKLAILDGDPGVGKSLLALDLAARLSRGGPLPGGSSCARPHSTILLSGEDSASDTIRPRAEAAGADLDRLLIICSGEGGLMRFPADAAQLESMIRENRADLAVIDPVMAFLPPEVASNTDQCVRGILCLLAGLAARTDCAILLIRHLRKKGAAKAVHRGLGSIGIIGAVRTGLLLASHPATPELRVLAVTKTNLSSRPPALGFRIRGGNTARVTIEWDAAVEITADALGIPAARALHPRDRACDWLLQQVASGPRRVVHLLAAAAEASIPERTLNRAKAELGIRAYKHISRVEEAWYWYDPAAPWPADAPFAKPTPGELPPLEPLW